MLEANSGSITLEGTESGIRMEVSPRFERRDLLTAVSVCLMALVIGGLIYEASRPHPHHSSTGLVLRGAVWSIWMWNLGSKLWKRVRATTVTLNPGILTIQRRMFGISGSVREFRTSELHNLRLGWPNYMPNKGRPSELQIDRDYKTIVLVSNITEEEGTTLMTRMKEFCNFPKYPSSNPAA